MPRLTRRKGQLEAEPTVGVDRARAGGPRRYGERAREIGIAIARAQLLLGLRPLGRDPSAAHDAVGFDLEDIREIGAQNDLELKAHRLHAVIGDIQVLVHAAGVTITKRPASRGWDFTRITGEAIHAQHPDQYSRPGAPGDYRTLEQTHLLHELTDDAERLEPALTSDDPRLLAPGVRIPADDDWDLPAEMESVRDHTDYFDPNDSLYPRWGGARMTEGDYWEMLEPHATTERINHEVNY